MHSRFAFKEFFKSLPKFLNLIELKTSFYASTDDVADIRDEDLMHLEFLTKLTTFSLFTFSRTSVTLPTILKILMLCPNLKFFEINGFRQCLSPDGAFLNDNDIYKRFNRAYLEKYKRDAPIYGDNNDIWF